MLLFYDKARGKPAFLVQPSPLSHSDGGNEKTPVDRRCAPARGGLGTDLPSSPHLVERERERLTACADPQLVSLQQTTGTVAWCECAGVQGATLGPKRPASKQARGRENLPFVCACSPSSISALSLLSKRGPCQHSTTPRAQTEAIAMRVSQAVDTKTPVLLQRLGGL